VKAHRSFSLILLMILALEKFVQHMVVTYAFATNLGGIRKLVSFDYRFFMVSGFLVGLLFLLSLVLMTRRARFGLNLLLGLALFDCVGEFVGQGKLAIEINVSFLVASLIIILYFLARRGLSESA
jgi:hypothetical protein